MFIVSYLHLSSNSVPADQIDATGHWTGNTWREIYGAKIPKSVCGQS